MNDLEILAEYHRHRDADAFRQLVFTYQGMVYSVCRRVLGPRRRRRCHAGNLPETRQGRRAGRAQPRRVAVCQRPAYVEQQVQGKRGSSISYTTSSGRMNRKLTTSPCECLR